MWGKFKDWLIKYRPVKKSERQFYRSVTSILGFSPANISYYRDALQHKSAWNLSGDKNSTYHNERLEFLGDAVLSMLVSEFLYEKFPAYNEGLLSETRTRLINRTFLNKVAFNLGIHEVLTHYVQTRGSKSMHSIYGNALEALLGAIYLDRGFPYARKFFFEKIVLGFPEFEKALKKEVNYKSRILEWGQKYNKTIVFERLNVDDENSRSFTIAVLVDGVEMGTGKSSKKKKAEQIAAAKALRQVRNADQAKAEQ